MRNRIHFTLQAALAVCALLALAMVVAAAPQGPQQQQPFVVHHLNDTVTGLTVPIYWIEGGGGNTGVIIGDKGVIVIDAKTTPRAGKEVVDDIAKLTTSPSPT